MLLPLIVFLLSFVVLCIIKWPFVLGALGYAFIFAAVAAVVRRLFILIGTWINAAYE